MKYILGIDQGTSSSRAVLMRRDGALAYSAQRALPQIFPQSGWVEQDAEAIWELQAAAIRDVLGESGVNAAEIAGIGITNQRETTIVWERASGRPIANAIVWQDRRTAADCDMLAERHGERLETTLREKTGLRLDAYFSATKIRWILDHTRGARGRAERGELAFGTVDSWLVWKLTGGHSHITDVTNASRTLLFNIATLAWDDELLEVFEVPRAMLPEVVPSSGHLAVATELVPGKVIAGIAGDQQAALLGQMCIEPGAAKNTYGTGCFLMLQTGAQPVRSRHGLLTTVAWQIGGSTQYALEGSIFIAGALVQWLRDGLGILNSAAEIEALAASVEDSGGVVIVPALTGLGAPHWDPHARGAMFGLTRGTTRAHIARAALEAIAFEVAEVLRAMEIDAGAAGAMRIRELRVDGGASVNDLLMQIQANLLDVPVVRAENAETTVLGACFLASIGCGLAGGLDDLAALWRESRRFLPQISAAGRKRQLAGWRRAVERVRGWDSPDVEFSSVEARHESRRSGGE